ncbi:hypothetical protein ACP70R_036229 [Stipagrostis hirtigluma subsp. patula]
MISVRLRFVKLLEKNLMPLCAAPIIAGDASASKQEEVKCLTGGKIKKKVVESSMQPSYWNPSCSQPQLEEQKLSYSFEKFHSNVS